ncbi:hypothetical protein [Cohnella sp.]|uniref:hypothetical protein n=1 Tax=Cohnella sp. TaxID=1883426 RepID=UPI003703CA72
MFYEFAHRHTPCLVDGQSDKVILSRDTRATTVIGKEYQYNGVFAPTSAVQNGSLIETDDTFFVQTLRPTTAQDRYCSLIKINDRITIQRYTKTFDANDNATAEFVTAQEDCPTFAQLITAQLRQDEPGLLPTTVYVLQLLTSAAVRDPREVSLPSPDRIILNGRPYKADVVDRVKYPNLLFVQLSEDAR